VKTSLKGHKLPENHADAKVLSDYGLQLFRVCRRCDKGLAETDAATTFLGWQETQISGLCEPCFDRMFKEPA
jgi:hypothetical protein